MATKPEDVVTSPSNPQNGRPWNEFALKAMSTIVARKHNIVVPLGNLSDLSDEELASRLRLVSELAHLPPG